MKIKINPFIYLPVTSILCFITSYTIMYGCTRGLNSIQAGVLVCLIVTIHMIFYYMGRKAAR